MPLFGSKKDKKMDMPEVADFSNDTWSYKGNPPDYQIQSDGFTYDVTDADGNDKNAISLGLAGMIVIVLNAKSPKIKEDELLPQFGKVIKTRNWHSMTVKEANFLVQTAIKKLTNSATSGDVFDLASYAPLEVKRVLLKTLFTISRTQLPPEFREEAEHRIIDDIVPDIFANPDYELALLTGLIVKADEKASEPISSRIETSPILEPNSQFNTKNYGTGDLCRETPVYSEPEPDSAFAELQKIYGRKIDTMPVRKAAPVQNNFTASETDIHEEKPADTAQNSKPDFGKPQPNNPFNVNTPNGNAQAPSGNYMGQQINPAQPVNEPGSASQPSQPSGTNFSAPQPRNPFAGPQPMNIPQPPMPNYGMQQPNYPYPQGYPQMNPYMGNNQQFQQQVWQQNQQNPQNQQMGQDVITQNSPRLPMQQVWQQFPQNMQNSQANPQNFNPNQNTEGNMVQGYPNWPNRGQYYPQQQQNNQNS